MSKTSCFHITSFTVLDTSTIIKNAGILAYIYNIQLKHQMQLIRKALFIFKGSVFITYKRNRGTRDAHRLIYKTNAKTVQYVQVKIQLVNM